MVYALKYRSNYLVLMVLLSFFLVSCDKPKETVEQAVSDVKEKTEEVIDESAEKASDLTNDAAESLEKENVNQFLLGVWIGKFDSRGTTLTIESVNGNEFDGKITINYRDVINQKVKGSINPDDQTIKMEDQLHSRFRGKYKGKLTEDNNTFSGKFVMDRNSSEFNFNLKKK